MNAVAIAIIEADAFNVPAFEQLLGLIMHNMLHLSEYHFNMFSGLQMLNELCIFEFDNSVQNPPSNWLQPLHEHLEYFVYDGDIGNESVLTHLFGGPPMMELKIIDISCWNRPLHMIAAANFTGLIAIDYLALIECGIQFIQKGTFDRMTATMTQINLSKNPLLKLSVTPFRMYLDRWPANVPSVVKTLVLYVLGDEPLNCTRGLYRLRNITLIALEYNLDRFHDMHCVNDVHTDKVSHQQTIHPDRWRLPHADVQKYAFRRFQLRYVAANRSVTVQQPKSSAYRLLVWPIGSEVASEQRCLSPMHVMCHRGNRAIETTFIPTFNKSHQSDRANLAAACVIYISLRKHSLPLHCITMHLKELTMDDGFVFSWYYFGKGVITGYLIVVSVIIAVILCKQFLSGNCDGIE